MDKWDRSNDELLVKLWGRYSVSEVAGILGCKRGVIYAQGRRLGLEPPTGWRVPPIEGRVVPAKFNNVAERVVAPGIEKHLTPLLHYRGSASLGRVHRLWNHTLSMMLHELESTADGFALINHPLYSHICEPWKPPSNTGMQGFWSRLLDKPQVADLVPGLREYVDGLVRWRFELTPVSEVSRSRSHAWWRHYEAPVKTKAELRERAAKKAEPKTAELMWPYIRHDHERPTNSGNDLVMAVNAVVSRRIPEENRADICQDLIMSILEGKFSVDDVRDNPKKYIDGVRRASPWKYEWVSLDAPLFGEGNLTLAEVLPG